MGLYWRLYFLDDLIADEPDDECSIGHVGRNDACAIAVCVDRDGKRVPIVGEPLNVIGASMIGRDPDDYLRERGATPWMPIFYRRKSMALDGSGPQTDMVVFGRGRRDINDKVKVSLWGITREGQVIDCPDWAIDVPAAEALIGVA